MTLRQSAAPSVTPVSLAEAKAHLRVDGSDEDSLITALIEAAASHIDGDGELGRAMVTQTWEQSFAQAPYRVQLQMGPFQAISAVQYYDADNALQSATITDFETWQDGDFVTMKPKEGFDWPAAYTRPDAIKVTYTAGFGDDGSDVPQAIRHAILLMVGHWFENRMAVSDVSMKEVPLAVSALLGNQRVGWYG